MKSYTVFYVNRQTHERIAKSAGESLNGAVMYVQHHRPGKPDYRKSPERAHFDKKGHFEIVEVEVES